MVRITGLFAAILFAGCASTTARPILRERDGGIVAIPDNSDRFPDYNRSQALDLIEEHVGKQFEIVREEEFVLGPVTTSETTSTKRPVWSWFIPWRLSESASSSSTNTTRNQTEYRLQYRKVDGTRTTDLPPLADGVGER